MLFFKNLKCLFSDLSLKNNNREDDETHEEVIQAKKLARKREHSKGTCKLSNYFNNAQSRSSTPDALQRQPFFVRTGLVHVQTIT